MLPGACWLVAWQARHASLLAAAGAMGAAGQACTQVPSKSKHSDSSLEADTSLPITMGLAPHLLCCLLPEPECLCLPGSRLKRGSGAPLQPALRAPSALCCCNLLALFPARAGTRVPLATSSATCCRAKAPAAPCFFGCSEAADCSAAARSASANADAAPSFKCTCGEPRKSKCGSLTLLGSLI